MSLQQTTQQMGLDFSRNPNQFTIDWSLKSFFQQENVPQEKCMNFEELQ